MVQGQQHAWVCWHMTHCEYTLQIEVTDQTTNQTWWFACNEWLDSHLGDCKIERVLKALASDPLNSQKDYKVGTDTGAWAAALRPHVQINSLINE